MVCSASAFLAVDIGRQSPHKLTGRSPPKPILRWQVSFLDANISFCEGLQQQTRSQTSQKDNDPNDFKRGAWLSMLQALDLPLNGLL
jgi:hypothetical protein